MYIYVPALNVYIYVPAIYRCDKYLRHGKVPQTMNYLFVELTYWLTLPFVLFACIKYLHVVTCNYLHVTTCKINVARKLKLFTYV